MEIPTFKKKTPVLSYMHWIWKNKFMLHVYFFPVNKKSILVGKNDTANNENNAH